MNQPTDFFTHQELNPHNYPETPEISGNLSILHERLNELRSTYGRPMVITSCLRSQAQQQELIAQGKSNAPKSHHLTGEAVDIQDTSGSFYDWCKANEDILIKIGFWMEERQGGWQHLQICPPKSGSRWFKP